MQRSWEAPQESEAWRMLPENDCFEEQCLQEALSRALTRKQPEYWGHEEQEEEEELVADRPLR